MAATRELPQLLAGELLLRLAHRGAEVQQLVDLLAALADEHVHQPGAPRRPSQALYGGGEAAVAGPHRLGDAGVAGRRELRRSQSVELVGDGVEVHDKNDGTCPRPVGR